MRLWLLGLAMIYAAPSAVMAQSQSPLLTPGPILPRSDPGSRTPLTVPPLQRGTGSGLGGFLPPLPGSGGPDLDPLDAPAAIGVSPRTGRTQAARAPVRSARPRLLDPSQAARALQTAVDGAVGRSASLQGAPARRSLAEVKQRAAGAFLPGAPTVSGAYVTDEAIRNRNARDAEISLSTPIWLPGEGTASVRAADADLSRVDAEAARQRLEVAGQVREALAAVAVAEADQLAASARLRDSRALEADLARRVRGRDAAETELLVANADRIEAETALSERAASLATAQEDYRTLTGLEPETAALNERAAAAPEAQSADPRLAEAQSADPRLAEARRTLDAAQADRELAKIQSRDSPQVALVGRQTRDINGNTFDHSIGIQISIPFATYARNAPRRAAAEVAYGDALASLAKLERDLGGGERRARIALASAEQIRDLGIKRAAVFEHQRALFERSYAGGQTSLADLIRARTLAFQAENTRDRADIGARQARSRLNQAVGMMP